METSPHTCIFASQGLAEWIVNPWLGKMTHMLCFVFTWSAVSWSTLSDKKSDTPLIHRVKHMIPLGCSGSCD